MSDKDGIENARNGIALVGEIIKAAGDSAHVKTAGDNLGKVAVTLTSALNNCLLPLAAVNYAFDGARKYFSTKFAEELNLKTGQVPPDKLEVPKASIAGPALQGLAFAYEETSLKEMYLNLLATAMDSRHSSKAHPAFAEIIKQLSAAEAELLGNIVGNPLFMGIVQVRESEVGKEGYIIAANHVLDLRATEDKEQLVEEPLLPSMIENWIRLGLVFVDYSRHVAGPKAYDWAEVRPEVLRLRSRVGLPSSSILVQKGYISRTEFGARFAESVGLVADNLVVINSQTVD